MVLLMNVVEVIMQQKGHLISKSGKKQRVPYGKFQPDTTFTTDKPHPVPILYQEGVIKGLSGSFQCLAKFPILFIIQSSLNRNTVIIYKCYIKGSYPYREVDQLDVWYHVLLQNVTPGV